MIPLFCFVTVGEGGMMIEDLSLAAVEAIDDARELFRLARNIL